MPREKYTKEFLEEKVKSSTNFTEVVTKIYGKKIHGGQYSHIVKRIKQFKIDTSHFIKVVSRPPNNKKNKEDILVYDPDRIWKQNRYKLKRALLESGVEYRCENCKNNGFWDNKELKLQIDHINGDWQDNRKENLRFLCPNCHSQTETFGKGKKKTFGEGKKKRIQFKCGCGGIKSKKSLNCRTCAGLNRPSKIEKPTKEVLEKLIWEKPTTHIAKEYGVSDKAVEKWCKKYSIEKPPRGYWMKNGYK